MNLSWLVRRSAVALVTAVAVLVPAACSKDSTGPGSGGSATLTDPTSDTFGSLPVQWDLTGLTVSRDAGGITVEMDFSNNVVSPMSGDTTAVIAFVDFDTDQDSTTGASSIVDSFRPTSGSTGLGVEYRLDMSSYNADSTVAVIDSAGTTGFVKPVFSGKRITVRIPKALLGNDDGYLNAAVIVGSELEPTDIAPNTGHLSLHQ